MYFVFRADSSFDIGTGHIMRCMALANALRDIGHECSFICKNHDGNINSLLLENNFEVYELQVSKLKENLALDQNIDQLSHHSWLGSSWAHDADLTNSILYKRKPDWVVVDHYALDVSWHKKIRSNTKKIMVVDDLADRHHDCEILLDQNLGADVDHYIKLVPSKCKIFLGPKYALLRPEFKRLREESLFKKRFGKLRHILINFGGGDKLNLTEKVLKNLSQIKLPKNIKIDVVLGPQVSLGTNIYSFRNVFFEKINFLQNVTNMAEIMTKSDLAISAGGSTSWERCALGLPTIIFSTADNQKKITKNIAKHGAGISACELSLTNGEFNASVQKFYSRDVLFCYSRAASKITEGGGASILIGKFND